MDLQHHGIGSQSGQPAGPGDGHVPVRRSVALVERRGEVFLALDYDLDDRGPAFTFDVSWSGYWDDGVDFIEQSPRFEDAAEAVDWGRQRAPHVLIRLVDEYLWAGDGAAPIHDRTGEPLERFDREDPRGRPEGGRAAAAQLRAKFARQREADDGAAFEPLGRRARRIREEVGIDLDTMSARLGVSSERLAAMESGDPTASFRPAQWFDWAWALRNPWPHPRRGRGTVGPINIAWTPGSEDIVDLALDVVRIDLGEADPSVLDRRLRNRRQLPP